MATVKTEFGRANKKNVRTVYLNIRQGDSRKRINTQIKVFSEEIDKRTGFIKNMEKAIQVEKLRLKIEQRITQLEVKVTGVDSKNADYIASKVDDSRRPTDDFFAFTDKWLSRSDIKGKKNYLAMLNSVEKFQRCRTLPFSDINYAWLKDYEMFLKNKPRAQSLYIGSIRHIFREAMLELNTDDEIIIKSDPFLRYKAPKQVLKKGVRALTERDIINIYNYHSNLPGGRAQLARDCFILSFCLMGMNSADLFSATKIKKHVIMYNRMKTKDRRSDNAYIEVNVHPFIQDLVKKYRGSTHVFNFYTRYSSFVDFNRAINIGLKDVGRAVGIPKLEFYQARHTFATLSRNLMRFSKGDVDEALNHVGSYSIADVYIAKDFSIINDNNFKLLETVFKDQLEAAKKIV